MSIISISNTQEWISFLKENEEKFATNKKLSHKMFLRMLDYKLGIAERMKIWFDRENNLCIHDECGFDDWHLYENEVEYDECECSDPYCKDKMYTNHFIKTSKNGYLHSFNENRAFVLSRDNGNYRVCESFKDGLLHNQNYDARQVTDNTYDDEYTYYEYYLNGKRVEKKDLKTE